MTAVKSFAAGGERRTERVALPRVGCHRIRPSMSAARGRRGRALRHRLPIAADYGLMLRAIELHDFRPLKIKHVLIDMMQGGDSTSGLSAYATDNFEAVRSPQKWLNAGAFDRALVAKPSRKLGQFLLR